MKILIVTNHQPDIPPFMISNIEYAKTIFDQIYYVNTRYPSNAEAIIGKNIFFKNPSKLRRLLNCCLIPFCFLRKEVFVQLFDFSKNKGIDFHYLKQMCYYLGADLCLKPIINSIVLNNRDVQITILSTWFGACAYTTARIKKKFPFVKAVSLAHSYEILISRNRYIPYFFKDFKHKLLDGVFFISSKMRQLYFDGVGPLPTAYIKKTHIIHLGSFRENESLNSIIFGSLKLCSCSRLIPLKRVGMLIDFLRDWDCGMVHWTHIGAGELYDQLVQEANDVMKSNPRVSISFVGWKSNKEVKDFYENNPIDLFVNLSTIEGIPISIMEAMSYGIPVVATDVGGTSEIVTPESGYLLPSNFSKDDLQRVFKDYLSQSQDNIIQLRKKTYELWFNNYNAERNIKKLFTQIFII